MNKHIFRTFLLFVFSLSACNIPLLGAAGANEEQPTEAVSNDLPSLQTIDIVGPLMEVGSTYRYVDGTLLVAVPGGVFIMGGSNIDNPMHEVSLSDFWVIVQKLPMLNIQDV
jgi:formylglycine-generating enzyme required for sulfatase activity